MTNGESWSMVQLTDLHIVEHGVLAMGLVDTAAYLERAVATITGLRPTPDLVVASGDLVDDGRKASYANLVELLAPIEAPLLLLPGNHDSLDNLRGAFGAAGSTSMVPDGSANSSGLADVVVDGSVTVIGIDTSRAPDPAGHLEAAQLEWLDETLATRSDRPAVVVMHHPPFETGIREMDAMALHPGDATRLASVIARHPHVERICCGHVHRTISRRWAGTIAAVAPGTAHAVALTLDGEPEAWTNEPPAVTVLAWSAELGLVAHQLATGAFPATPY